MKFKFNFLFIILFSSLLFWNCSSDDDGGTTPAAPKNYFPLVMDNEWQYENKQTANDETLTSAETLNVESEEQTENGSIFILSSTDLEATASFTSILSNGELFKNQNQLLLTGNVDIGLDLGELPDFDIDFEELVVYNSDALAGDILFSDDRNTELPEFEDITLNLNLSIESISLGNLDNLEVNGVIYEDVIGSQFVVSLGIEATTSIPPLPFPITIEILEFQEIVTSTNYFADGVGLVQSETNLSVVFSEELDIIPNFDLENIMVIVEQKLADFQVTLEE